MVLFVQLDEKFKNYVRLIHQVETFGKLKEVYEITDNWYLYKFADIDEDYEYDLDDICANSDAVVDWWFE